MTAVTATCNPEMIEIATSLGLKGLNISNTVQIAVIYPKSAQLIFSVVL